MHFIIGLVSIVRYRMTVALSTTANMADSGEQRTTSLPFKRLPKKEKTFQNSYLLGVALVMSLDYLCEEVLTD